MLLNFKIDNQNVIMYNKVICHDYTCHRNLQPTVFLVEMRSNVSVIEYIETWKVMPLGFLSWI